MAKSLQQITFAFSGEESKEPKKKLSDQPVASNNGKPKSKRGRKPSKDIEAEADLVNIPEDDILFKKQYYSIGEVAAMFNVNVSLLRYWETEFDIIEPRKNRKGDRFFKPADVKNLYLIYDLVRRRKFTIEGAKEYIKNNRQAGEKIELIQALQRLKNFLLQLKADL